MDRAFYRPVWVLGAEIDQSLPAQRAINLKIKTGPFDIAELLTAVKDMNNDKAAGLDGYSIEVEKYIAGEQYMEMELAIAEWGNAGDNAGCDYHGSIQRERPQRHL
jgi:hypothetical protein